MFEKQGSPAGSPLKDTPSSAEGSTVQDQGSAAQPLRAEREKPLPNQAISLPTAIWPGISLHWESPIREIVLYTELPFWLLVADCELEVTVGDCTLPLSIVSQAIEIQLGRTYRESHRNAALIEKVQGELSARAQTILRGAKQEGFTLRTTRTLVSIKTKAIEDAIVAVQEQGRRRVDADMYFRSFVHAHLAFVNKAINAYRRVAADPFAIEVTEWDLNVWYLDVQDKFIPISLIPYKETDGVPHSRNFGSEVKPIAFVEPKDIEAALSLPEVPGEIDILDAWSLYYRGRQSDAIRSIVTSIEVLLEAKLQDALRKKGLSESDVQRRLDESWNNFQARLTEYLHASGRRVPGPIISVIPYINGVRLREELEQVRSIRHQIVHEGERISYPFRGQMQRVMETMTWLFNWLAESPLQRKHRIEGNPLKTSMRGELTLDYEYTSSGVVVVRFERQAQAIVVFEEELRRQLVAAIEKGTADVEKFALMAVKEIGLNGIDAPAPEPGSSFLFERLILVEGGSFIPLFLHDTHEVLSPEIVGRVAARVLALKLQGKPFSLALLIVNTQCGLEWQYREVGEAISDAANQMALQCGIGIVTTVDLLLLIRAAEAQLWSFEEVKQCLMRAGRAGCEPPGYRYAGYVRKFFDRPRVASIVLDDSITLHQGDSLLIRLADRYYSQKIESMEMNNVRVTEAHSCTVGVETTLRRSDVSVGDYVFSRAGILGISLEEEIARLVGEGCPNGD
jgi:hypothetical protein